MDKQSNDVNQQQEKPTTHNEKAQKVMLILGGVLVVALILSMFVGGGTHSPKPEQKEGYRPSTQYDSGTGFSDQMRLNKAQAKTSDPDQGILARMRSTQHGNFVSGSWRKKEDLRVLNSRMANFGFGLSNKPKKSAKHDLTSGSSRASQEGNSSNQLISHTPHQGLSLSQPQIDKLKRLFDKKRESDIKQIGNNIVGHVVDRFYSGGARAGELLIPTGSVITGTLDQDINSDYTGPWRGITTQDVYSVDNEYILIPKGSQLIGKSMHIGNVNEPIQNRMGLTVNWIVLPNGKRIDFKKQSVEDRSGLSGIGGHVNRHLLWQFGGVAAYALLSASMPRDSYNYGYQNPTFKGQLSDGIRGQLAPMVSKYLSLVPTVKIAAGTPIKIFIKDDVYSKPWARVNKTVY